MNEKILPQYTDNISVGFEQIVGFLDSGKNCIVYGANNSGKTTLLNKVNELYIERNISALFSNNKGGLCPCVIIPAKRVFELEDGGVMQNRESLSIDVVRRFGKEWTTGSFILSVREKIKNSRLGKKVSSMCTKILGPSVGDVFGTRCSDGIQNIVNILSYIFHILSLYAGSDELADILNARFLLIIDEIELFLYSKTVVLFLQELFSTFKNMTALFSSHSILVMQRINSFNVLYVSGENEIYDRGLSPYFQDFETILASFYDIKEYPDELEGFLTHLDLSLRKKEINETELRAIFEEADYLRSRYPVFSEVITNLQTNFYKRLRKNATLK